jgi:hypothetical protein
VVYYKALFIYIDMNIRGILEYIHLMYCMQTIVS